MVKIVKKITKGDITKVILETVKVAGVITSVLLAPNVAKSFIKMGIVGHHRQNEVIQRARNNLIKNKCLIRDSKGFLRLTKAGTDKLNSFELSDYKLIIPRFWDKKWRVLIFDIPESRRVLRDKVRRTLISIGFKRMQDSVWVFPYDCAELVILLKADFKVGKDILYMVVDTIENDR